MTENSDLINKISLCEKLCVLLTPNPRRDHVTHDVTRFHHSKNDNT